MINVPQKKATIRRPKTAIDWESVASGEKQHKVWKPGEQQQTTAAAKDNLQNKLRDTEGQRLEAYDQEIVIILTLGV